MNIVKIVLLCITLAFAEQLLQETPFDTLRGFAYNPYGTLGADPTIADILQKPSDIYGHKFIYASPVSGSGYSTFDLAGGSVLLSFDRSLMLGYAKSFYGLLLRVSPQKLCNRNSNDNFECSSNQNIGLNFSVPLDGSILYAHTGKTNTVDYNYEEYESGYVRYKRESALKEAYIGITGGNELVWDLSFGFDRYKVSFSGLGWNDFTPYEIDVSEYLTNIKFLFNFSYKILHGDRFKFIVGLNDHLSYQSHTLSYNDNAEYSLLAMIFPNFFGEIALTKHLLAFVGASYRISSYVVFLSSEDEKTETRAFGIDNYEPSAYAGLRYEYKNWAIETRLQSDAVGEILSRNNPFIELGVFFFFQ